MGALATGLAAVDGYWFEPRWIADEKLSVRVVGLGEGWQNATVAVLSDAHCGPYTNHSYIEHSVQMAS